MLSSALFRRIELILLSNGSPISAMILRISKMDFISMNDMYHHLINKFKSEMVMVRIIIDIIGVIKGLTG